MGPHTPYGRPHTHGGPHTQVDSVPMADTVPQPVMYSMFSCEIISPHVYRVISSDLVLDAAVAALLSDAGGVAERGEKLLGRFFFEGTSTEYY